MTLDRIHAPYNFAPISRDVCWPEWSGHASQDIPFEDGICASLTYTIHAETPIFTRGEEKERVLHHRRLPEPDGRYFFPGSSVRGAIRNVLEIVTFSKLSRVNDHTYGVRDLHNRDVYGKHMAEIMRTSNQGRPEPVPLVSAGWLEIAREAEQDEGAPDQVVARIHPCHFAKVPYGILLDIARKKNNHRFNPGRKQSSPEKYRDFGVSGKPEEWAQQKSLLDAALDILALRPRGQSSSGVPYVSDFGRASCEPGGTWGRLVFTGQPSEWRPNAPKRRGAGNAKHHDFFFYTRQNEALRPLNVTRKVFAAFEFVHSDRGQQNRLTAQPNEEWKFWERLYRKGDRIPVFFLQNKDGSLRAFGLAMMFRLAYEHSTRDAVLHGQPDAASWDLDFAETLLGRVPFRSEDTYKELKGRVVFGHAVAPKANVLPTVTAVLGAPKASYYPSYVEQKPDEREVKPGARPTGEYRTYMDKGTVVRGWKRYRPFQAANLRPPLPAKSTERVQTRFLPLDRGTTFQGTLHLHNVRPVELGALLWAMRLGGEPEVFHTLGMARSLGFGRSRITVEPPARLERNDGTTISLEECEQAFQEHMEAWAAAQKIPGGWRGSQQIFQLLASARPFEKAADGRSMMLDHPDFRNEFNEAKKSKLVLNPAGSPDDWARAHPDQRSRAPRPSQPNPPRPPEPRRDAGRPSAPQPTPPPAPTQSKATPPRQTPPTPSIPEEPAPSELPPQFMARFHGFRGAKDAKNTLRERRKRGKTAKNALLRVVPEKSNLRGLAERLQISTTRTEGFEGYFDRLAEKYMGVEHPFRVVSWSKQEDGTLLVDRMELVEK